MKHLDADCRFLESEHKIICVLLVFDIEKLLFEYLFELLLFFGLVSRFLNKFLREIFNPFFLLITAYG